MTHLSCPSETQPLSCRPVKVRLMTGADLDQLSALEIRSERGLNCGFLSFFRAYHFDNLLPGSVYTVEVSSVSGDRRSLPSAVNTNTRECDYTYIGTKLTVSHKSTN